jgi:signal transduction histidine kinase/ActR/RegA family two-component response regulator
VLHTGEFRVAVHPSRRTITTRALFARIAIMVAVAIAGVAAAGWFAADALTHRIQRQEGLRTAGRARAAVERRAEAWANIAQEYGYWDQMWSYMDAPRTAAARAWVRENYLDWFPAHYGVTYIGLLDRERRPVMVWSDTAAAASAPAFSTGELLDLIDQELSVAGLLRTEQGLFLYAGAAVMRTNHVTPGDPRNGYVLLALPVTDSLVAGLAGDLQEHVQFLDASGATGRVNRHDSTEVRVAMVDPLGRPAATLLLRGSSSFLESTERWLRAVLIAIALIAGFTIVVAWLMARRLVVEPARVIAAQLETMQHRGKLSCIELPGGSAEWVTMASAFNATVSALAESESHLRRAQKMEAVGTLAGGLAHDFNNTLGAVLAAAALLRQDTPAGSEQAELLETIEASARRSAELTRQLLSLSRPDQFRFGAVKLGDVVQQVTGLCGHTFPRSIRLVTELRDAPLVQGDPGQLEQALLNLCINARDAMPAGGTLTIETGVTALDARTAAALRLSRPGTYARLAVVDTGEGMDEEVQRRLFEPFFTTKPAGRGTGLGLTMVYGAVRAHRGAVRLTSAVGRGSRFELYLPLAEAPALAAAPAKIDVKPRGTETILVVDDEEAMRRVVGKALGRLGYRVLEAANGVEALRVLEQGQQVSGVLLDMMMPEMSGPEAFPQIRRLVPGLPVVVMTGFTEEGVIERMLDLGADAVLTKPFDIGELARVIRAAVDASGRRERPGPRLVANSG